MDSYHKIRIENEQNAIPQLQPEYLKYYDRFTLGGSVKEYVGYHHMSNNNVNFSVGLECIQGFTRGMRDYQIDLMGPYHDQRIDIYIGLRAGWIFPVFRKALTSITTTNDSYTLQFHILWNPTVLGVWRLFGNHKSRISIKGRINWKKNLLTLILVEAYMGTCFFTW